MAGTQLQTLRTELRARLGLAAAADTLATNKAILNSILARCQSWLYWNYDWDQLRRVWPVPLTVGLATYSLPVNGNGEVVESRRIVDVYLLAASGAFLNDLREGIPAGLRNTNVANGPPARYSTRGTGLSVYPPPDLNTYTLDLDGSKVLAAFAADTDTSTMDDDPILDLAVALGKYHYGQADGGVYVSLVNQLIEKLNESNEASGRVELLSSPGSATAPMLPGKREG